jgi:outer membrane protein assembly factor BamB
VRAGDCGSGLLCQDGFCTAVPASDAGTVSPDQPSLPGTLVHGADARTWVRSFPGITMVDPNVVRGPHGEILVNVRSERLPHTYEGTMPTDDWLIRFDADTGEMLWIEKVDPWPSIAIDSMGNIVLAWPTLLQKLDATGSLLWSVPRAAQQAFETVWVAMDGAGNIVLARMELDGDPLAIGPNPKGYLTLEKLDGNGGSLWVRKFGDGTSVVFGAVAAVDSASNIVFLSPWVEGGVDFGGGPLTGKNVLAKFDGDGTHLWSKVLGGFASNSLPNPTPVVVDGDSNILIANEVSEPVDIGLGVLWCGPEMVFKLNPNGVPQWNKCMPVEYLSAMPDGGFVTSTRVFESIKVGNQVCNPEDEYDGALALYDKDGNGSKTYCLSQPGWQSFGAIIPDALGTFILAGGGPLTLPGGMAVAPIDRSAWTSYVARIAPWN